MQSDVIKSNVEIAVETALTTGLALFNCYFQKPACRLEATKVHEPTETSFGFITWKAIYLDGTESFSFMYGNTGNDVSKRINETFNAMLPTCLSTRKAGAQ